MSTDLLARLKTAWEVARDDGGDYRNSAIQLLQDDLAIGCEKLDSLLVDHTSESELQQCLSDHPSLLLNVLWNGLNPIALDRAGLYRHVQIAGKKEPDFGLVQSDSGGFTWMFVELKKHTATITNASGLASREMESALKHVRDWEREIRDNRLSVGRDLQELCRNDVSHMIASKSWDRNPYHCIIIGRASELVDPEKKRFRADIESQYQRVRIMSWDRILRDIPLSRAHADRAYPYVKPPKLDGL